MADGGMVLSYDAVPMHADVADLAAVLAGGVRSIAGWVEILAHVHYGVLNPWQQAYVDSVRAACSARVGDLRPPPLRREIDLHFNCLPEIGSERLLLAPFERLMGLIFDMALLRRADRRCDLARRPARAQRSAHPHRRRYRRKLDRWGRPCLRPLRGDPRLP